MHDLTHDAADDGFHEIQLNGKQLVFLDSAQKWLLTGRYEIRHVGQGKASLKSGDDTQSEANLAYYVNPNAKVCLD